MAPREVQVSFLPPALLLGPRLAPDPRLGILHLEKEMISMFLQIEKVTHAGFIF